MSMITKKSPDPIDVRVGARVRIARLQSGLTQEKLAGKLGITFQQVQKYEKGTNRIAPSRLTTVANITKKPITFFYADAETAPEEAGQNDGVLGMFAAGGSELAAAYVQLSAKDRQVLTRVAAALATTSVTGIVRG